ncbi:MAG: PaaI family thioesterase [Pseudohongiellaceae bacterium]
MSNSPANPADHGLPAQYQHWYGDEAEDHNGPFFFTVNGDVVQTAFRVQGVNCNSHRTVHGGVLMMFADYTLCIAANGGRHESVVTVTCNVEFVGPAAEGDLVEGVGEVVRRGGSLIFVRATLRSAGRIILTASGVVKKVRPSP